MMKFFHSQLSTWFQEKRIVTLVYYLLYLLLVIAIDFEGISSIYERPMRSFECHHVKTGNCKITNGHEELFHIDGLTSYPKQKSSIDFLWGPQ